MIMPYEKQNAFNQVLPTSDQLPEFSSFLKNVRFSQVVQEKIRELNKNINQLQKETGISETTKNRLKKVEEQMAELFRLRSLHFKIPPEK